MTVIEWLTMAGMMLGLFGALIGSMKGILRDQWHEHRELHKEIKEELNENRDNIDRVRGRVISVEALCGIRHKTYEAEDRRDG